MNLNKMLKMAPFSLLTAVSLHMATPDYAEAQICTALIPNKPGDQIKLLINITSTNNCYFQQTGQFLRVKSLDGSFVKDIPISQFNQGPIEIDYKASKANEFIFADSHGEDYEQNIKCEIVAHINGLYAWQKKLAKKSIDGFAAVLVLGLSTQKAFCPGPAVAFCKALGTLNMGLALAGIATKKMADDPPDHNYTEIYQPVFVHLPRATTDGGINQATADSFDRVNDNLTRFAAYATAAYIAGNRAWGADLAGDRNWERRQMNAATDNAVAAGKILLDTDIFLADLMKKLTAAGYKINANREKNYLNTRNSLQNPEASADITAMMTSVMSAEDWEDYRHIAGDVRYVTFEGDNADKKLMFNKFFPDGLKSQLFKTVNDFGPYLASLQRLPSTSRLP